jgi:hypothetical protein
VIFAGDENGMSLENVYKEQIIPANAGVNAGTAA